MRILILLTALVAASALAAPASADAHTVGIDMPRWATAAFPAVERVTTVNLPRLTDGYAPRWLVAESAVGAVQGSFVAGRGFAKRVWLRDASWNGGHWRVRWRLMPTRYGTSYGRFVLSRGDMRLKFNGYS